MFAYGTGECAPVDVVTGPGNVYVAAAKRILQGQVGIDGENGPTEIGIIADHTADPAYLAADLIGQAEHDELAACLLITTDAGLPARVDEELQRQLPATKHTERVAGALGNQAGYVSSTTSRPAARVSDAWAPSTWRSRPRTPPRSPASPQRRRHLRRPLRAGLAGRLPGRLQPRAARPAARRGTPAGCRCSPYLRGRQRHRVRP